MEKATELMRDVRADRRQMGVEMKGNLDHFVTEDCIALPTVSMMWAPGGRGGKKITSLQNRFLVTSKFHLNLIQNLVAWEMDNVPMRMPHYTHKSKLYRFTTLHQRCNSNKE